MKMPIAEMVAAGVELAVGDERVVVRRRADPPRVVFQPKLIVRKSTGAVAVER